MRLANGTIRHLRRSFDLPGQAHELTFSCYHRFRFLSNDRSCQWFVEALDLARSKHSFELWSYVIMPEHVHVLLMPTRTEYQIAAVLKTIKQSVSRRAIGYLRRHAPEWLDRVAVRRSGRVEHRFWEAGGGYDRNVVSPDVVDGEKRSHCRKSPLGPLVVEHKTRNAPFVG